MIGFPAFPPESRRNPVIVDALFPTYRFDKADTDDFVVIDQWSYALAAFSGPLFVLSKRLYFLAFIDLLAMIAIAGGGIFGLTVVVHLFGSSWKACFSCSLPWLGPSR